MTDYQFVWDVTCPQCGAGHQQRCRNAYGERAKFHVARTRAAMPTPKNTTCE
jgi:hypothetical protein